MKKNDILILVALFGLWLLWGPIDRNFIRPTFFPDSPTADEVERVDPEEVDPRRADAVADPDPDDPDLREWEEVEPTVLDRPEAEREVGLETEDPLADIEPDDPDRMETLEDDLISVSFSARGGTIRELWLKNYPETMDDDSPPIRMDFSREPALAIEGFSGLSPRHEFAMERLPRGEGVRFVTELDSGIRFEREIRIADEYLFEISDRFHNTGEHPIPLPAYDLYTGRMDPMPGVASTYGTFPLGVDTLSPGDSVTRWGKNINNRWLDATTAAVAQESLDKPVDWVAVKNKYFAQSLRPRTLTAENCLIYIEREGTTDEPAAVWAALRFPEVTLGAGESLSSDMEFYIGPQEISRLTDLGYHQDRIMELGFAPIRFFARTLMIGLTFLYGIFNNYGVSIMLLTVIIRLVFWPLTHKGTESMRRMQELSPLMKELNEKYKDDAQKRQKAVMGLYKEHKVNPLGGCLPMIVQIPVFIGLFYLLRTAIDLRFANFLWIQDLSEPERLFADVLPMPLNILPLFMAFTMFLQQKLTPMPSTGDEKQQQMHGMMMKVMPVMMLVLLYNFASGLALYWSTQNVLMIVQQGLYRRRRARQKADKEAAGTAISPPAKKGAATPAATAGRKAPGKASGKKRKR